MAPGLNQFAASYLVSVHMGTMHPALSFFGQIDIARVREFPQLLQVCQWSYTLLRELSRQHPPNQCRTAALLNTMISHVGTETRASLTLIELFRNNEDLLLSLSSDVLEGIVSMLLSRCNSNNREPRYLQVLEIGYEFFL